MNDQKGFTLVELAFVMLIFGMITGAVMSGFSIYNKQAVMSQTDEAIESSNSALLEYVANFGVYPCPADPELGPGDILYGREQRVGAPTPGASNVTLDAAACVFPGAPVDGADTFDLGTDMLEDQVLIGAVPGVTITERLYANDGLNAPFSDFDTADGWGRKLKYAVTERLTNRNTYSNLFGAIEVTDEFNVLLMEDNEDINGNQLGDVGEDTDGNNRVDPGRYAHFVLVSHGKNGRGAYMRSGREVEPCVNATPVPPGAPVGTPNTDEIQNCDDTNGRFASGLMNETDWRYNDDTVKFSIFQNAALWRYTDLGQIENTNIGNVGIGIDTPQQRLHSRGDLTANRARARGYTDRNGNNFVPATSVGGNATEATSQAMQCPAGQVVTRVQGEDIGGGVIRPRVTCGTPFGTAAPPNMQCGIGAVSGTRMAMYGVDNAPGGGYQLLCCDRLAPTGSAQACP